MADDTDDKRNNESEAGADEASKMSSKSDLAEAKEELLAEVGETEEEAVEVEASTDVETQSDPVADEPDGLSSTDPEHVEGDIDLSPSTGEDLEEVVSELDASDRADEEVDSSEASSNLPEAVSNEGELTLDQEAEQEEEEALIVSSTETDDSQIASEEVISQEDEPTSVDAQAVIALKADSRLYIYGEAEDPMVGVTQNLDRARDLMLETMAKSRATTADSVQKARNLNFISGMFLCSALLAAVGFFVFMSIQMSQKIVEIDSLLTAVAKRSIQMTKGIEKFSLIEEQLDKSLVNQETISEHLSRDEPFRSQINERIEELRTQLKKDMSARVKRSEGNLSKTLDGVAASSNNNEQAIKQISTMVKNQGDPSKSIRELQRSLSEIEKKLNDLYLIERARVSQEISLQRDRGAEVETGGGLE